MYEKGGEEALIVYLHLLCMAVKQDREGKLMLYGSIPLDDATIARLMYKTEKAVESCMQMLIDFHLIRQTEDGVYSVLCLEQKSKRKQQRPTAVRRNLKKQLRYQALQARLRRLPCLTGDDAPS